MAKPTTPIDALVEAAQALADECAEAEKRGSSILQRPIICSHETILAMHKQMENKNWALHTLKEHVGIQRARIVELEAENRRLKEQRGRGDAGITPNS